MLFKSFFSRLYLATTDTNFYLRVISEPLVRAALFSVVALSALGLIQGFIQGQKYLPMIQAEMGLFIAELPIVLPQELTINWHSPVVDVTPETFVLPFPNKSQLQSKVESKNFVSVLNQQIPLSSVSAHLTESSLLVLTKDYLSVHVSNNQWSHFQLSEFIPVSEWSGGRDQVLTLAQAAQTYLTNNYWAVILAICVIQVTILLISSLWQALIYALMLMLVTQLLPIKFTFKQLLSITAYLLVVVEFIHTLNLLLFDVSVVGYTSLIFWGYCMVIYWRFMQLVQAGQQRK